MCFLAMNIRGMNCKLAAVGGGHQGKASDAVSHHHELGPIIGESLTIQRGTCAKERCGAIGRVPDLYICPSQTPI